MAAYGRCDLFRDPTATGEEEARELVARLERRGRLPDERETRAAYLGLLGIGPGQRVLDVGCGSGVVTRDLARRVAPGGLAVGLDPSPTFLTHAGALARADGLRDGIEFRLGGALAIPFPDGSFDAVVAATVLAHPDRALTRRIVAAHSDHGVVDGWLARRLPGLFLQAGFEEVGVRAFTPLDRDPSGFYGGTAERAAEVAVKVGAIDEAEREGWLVALRAQQAAGGFLAGRTHLFVWGTRPGAGGGRS